MSRMRIELILLLALGCGHGTASPPIQFEPAAWNSASAVDRGRMATDLLARHSLVGMAIDDVIGLLGRPYRDYSPLRDQRAVVYALGPEERDLFGCIHQRRLTLQVDDLGMVRAAVDEQFRD